MARTVPFSGLLSGLLLLLAPLATSAAEGWPNWRGPARTGVSAAADLPLAWDAEKNIAWKLPLPGVSGSTPIVAGERIFLNVATGGALQLWAIDSATGTALWKRPLDDRDEAKRKGNMSSPSPVTDGSTVWVMTGTGILKAFDFAGAELWRRDLQREFGAFGVLHGYSSSPLLDDGVLFVQVLHGFNTDDPSYVMAIDGASGTTRWRVERPTDAPREAPDAYTTPALLRRAGRTQLVVSGGDYVTGHDPANGKELWRVGGLNPTANPMQRIVASPVVEGDMIFVPSRVTPLLALAAGSAAEPALAWSFDEGPDVPTPAVTAEHVFILRDNGVMYCLDRVTGRVVWGPQRLAGGVYSASPVVAAGRVYVTNEAGVTTVVAAAAKFEVLAENSIAEYTLASLAAADGRLYLRTSDHLYAIGR